MYRWRRLSDRERDALLKDRVRQKLPWHSPPHPYGGEGEFHITAACYEHKPHLGRAPERLGEFAESLLECLSGTQVHAWCVLPNHYHLFLRTPNLKGTLASLGKLHGRTSFLWNGEENARGRQVWHGATDRAIRGEAHGWATLNYIHHNPVRHGYVSKWQDWPWSSAATYLDAVGPAEAQRIWREFPVLDYGEGWDDPRL